MTAPRHGPLWRLKVYFGVADDMPPTTLRTIVMNTVVAIVVFGVVVLIRHVL